MTNRSVLAIVGVATSLLGCAKATPKPKTYVDSKRAIQFEYPGDWTAENVAQPDVLLLSSPVQEANWQTNIFLELRTDMDATQPPDRRLATLAENLAKQKGGFALQTSRTLTHSSGLSAGELVYTHSSQGVPLTEKELILWLGDGRVLFVTGAAVTSLWGKYEGQMNTVFDSLRPLTK
jgi:hypothetical protein